MIEFTIKTLDSNNHTLSVDDDITVLGLKQKILEQLGIEIDQQRLIFFGRVLHDNKKLADYGVHGKVLHLVERPPPRFHRQRQQHTSQQRHQQSADEEMTRRMSEIQGPGTVDNESPATLARIEALERCIEDAKSLYDLLHRPDIWIPQLDSENTTPEFESLNGAGIYDPSMNKHTKRRAKRARSAHPRFPSGGFRSMDLAGSPQPGPSHADPEVASPSSPTSDDSSDSGMHVGAIATNIFTDRLGVVFEPRINVSPVKRFADLMAELMIIEKQVHEYRRLFIRWIRSTADMRVVLDEEEVRRRQQFSNLMSELHHCLAHAHHVSSDLTVLVTPTALRLTSDASVLSPIQVQVGSIVLASDGQGLMGYQQPGQMGRGQSGEMPPHAPPGQRHTRGNHQQFPAAAEIIMQQVLPGVQAPVMLGTPATALNINMQPNPVTFQLEIETRSLEAALLNTVSQFVASHANSAAASDAAANNAAANDTAANNPGANNPGANNPGANNPGANNPGANNPGANNPGVNNPGANNPGANADSAAAPRPTANLPTGARAHITPSILGLNIGTSWHLGTFNLGSINAGGIDVDNQSTPRGAANMETDGQGTDQGANNAPNTNQDNQTQNTQATRQMLFDFENLFRGLSQAHGFGDMEIVMSLEGSGQEESSGGAQAQSQSQPKTQAPAQTDTQGQSNSPDHDGAQTGSGQRRSGGPSEAPKSGPGEGSGNPQPKKDLPVYGPKTKEEVEAEEDGATATATAQIEAMAQEYAPSSARRPQSSTEDTETQRAPRRAVRSRMRAPTIPVSHGIYDRFLVCNSSHARRQLNRRRQAAEAARQKQEKRALQERARREDRESRDAPQNQSAVHTLMRLIRNPNTFGESWVVGLIVTIHEATTPEVYMVLAESEFEGLRAAMVSGVRQLTFVCSNRGLPVTPSAMADVILHQFREFIDNMNTITSIRPNVNAMGSIRAVFNMYMPALCAVLQRDGGSLCVASYRQLFASFFYDLACLLVHVARDGYRGFRAIFTGFIEELLPLVTTERSRDLVRMLSTSLLSRVVDHIKTNPSNPHQFVVRTDGLPQCICYDEAERFSRAFRRDSQETEPAQPEIEPPGQYPTESVNTVMRMASRLNFDEEMATALMLSVCESISTEPSVLWDEDYGTLRRLLAEYVQQFTRSFDVREDGMLDRTTAGVLDHLSYFARRIVNSPRLRHDTCIRASLHAAISHYMSDVVGLLMEIDDVFIKNFRGIISEMFCTVLTVLSTMTYDGIFGLKLIMREFINDILATIDNEKVREHLKIIGNYIVSQGIHTIQTRPVEFLQFLVTDGDRNVTMTEPQPSTSCHGMSSCSDDRASMTARRSMAEAIERSSFALAGRSNAERAAMTVPDAPHQPMFAVPERPASAFAARPFSTSDSSPFVAPQRPTSLAPEPSPFLVPERPASAASDRPAAISVKRLSSLTGDQQSSTLTVETPQLSSQDMMAAVAARLQAVSDQTSVTLAGAPDQPTPRSGPGERHQSKAEKRSSSRASSSDGSPSTSKPTPSKSRSKPSGPKHSTAEMMQCSSDQMPPAIAEETPMAGLERFQNFRNPYYPFRRPIEGRPQACYGCLNPAITAEQPYDPTATAPMFIFAKALAPRSQGGRAMPTATVTSGSLAAHRSSSASPNLVTDSPERAPPRQSTSSPTNKRMRQEGEGGENSNPQSIEGADQASASNESSNDDTCENRRKYPTYRPDRDSHDDESPKEDSSESNSQSRASKRCLDREWSQWGPVVEADRQVTPQPQPPFSDAYLTGMSARRRRRVRQARPPQEAGAFLHDCLSTASEQAIEGGDAERSVFGAFYNSFRSYAAARVNASNDYRPMQHAAVHKLLNESSIHKDRSETPEQQPNNNNNM